jgi:hypothetical protein
MATRGGIVISMLKLLFLGRFSFFAFWCVLVSHANSFPHTRPLDYPVDLRLAGRREPGCLSSISIADNIEVPGLNAGENPPDNLNDMVEPSSNF